MKYLPEHERVKKKLLKSMQELSKGRVFVSMPVTPLTPKSFLKKSKKHKIRKGIERRHGIFKLNQCALSPFDHGNLYGDGVFEGILIKHGRVYKLKEHLGRLQRSARAIGIILPYSEQEFCKHIIETANQAKIKTNDTAYIRLVVTRGIGTLGIDPRKCIAPTVYIIISQVTLYPKEKYKSGIHMSISKILRRPDKSIIDPTIKSLNYLNNIMAVLEGVINNRDKTVMEVLELTHKGYVAEASADNLFIVNKSKKQIVLLTAVDEYALEGITRQSIIEYAKKLNIKVIKSATILPEDLLGKQKEVFLTGTAAGVMPVVKFDGEKIGSGKPGIITKQLIALHNQDQQNKKSGLDLNSTPSRITKYLL